MPAGRGEDGARVARLDGVGAGAAEPAQVAPLDAVADTVSATHARADLTGLGGVVGDVARVASFTPADGPGSGPNEAPVALFEAERVGGGRTGVPVADFDASRRPAGRRTTRRSQPAEAASDQTPDSPGPDSPGPDSAAPDSAAPGRSRGGMAAGSDRGRKRGGRRPPGEIDPHADPVAVARETCLRLLTDRARTRQELAQSLRRKGVPDEAANTVLEGLDAVGLIDDAAFADQWVHSRHAYRGLARRAIAMELRRKGVDDEVAGEALAAVDAESEERRARELVDRKLRSLILETTEQRATVARRLVGMLARKGYGGGIAYRVVREALAAHGADAEEFAAD